MAAPRLEIDLRKIRHNTVSLVNRLSVRGISITGITKAVRGNAHIAVAMLQGGVRALGDSRIENIERMQRAGISAPMVLIRSPMISQAERVVASAGMSLNTEPDVIGKLDDAARKIGQTHNIVLMVELGDLREGIMPEDLVAVVRQTLRFPNISLEGIGTNLACRSGVSPDNRNMAQLSALAGTIDARFGPDIGSRLDVVSGGNSANLSWALGNNDTGRINNLRLGEALLLGVEPLRRQPIDGLYTDAITLVAEAIESKIKPSQPWGDIAQTAFGDAAPPRNRGHISQTIVAIGRQDTDTDGLVPPPGMQIIAASGDHLVLDTGKRCAVGTELRFQLNYSALMRSMNSPFVTQTHRVDPENTTATAKTPVPPDARHPENLSTERT